MAESGAYFIEKINSDAEEDSDTGETGNFTSALANLLNAVSECRRKEPKPPDKEAGDMRKENSEGSETGAGHEKKGTEDCQTPGENDDSSSSSDDADEESSSDDSLSNTDSSSSDSDEIDRIEAFTRLDLDGMLKKATRRVNLRKLFKPGQYESQCRLLQKRVRRIENKLSLLLELGLPLPNEDIIREKLGIRRTPPLEVGSSDSDSDDDWRGRSTKKGLPVFRGVTEEGTRARMEFIKKYVEDCQSGRRQVVERPLKKITKPTRIRRVVEERKPTFAPFKPAENHDGSGDAPSTSGYNTRPKSGVKYTEEYVPENDHFIFCDDCSSLYIDDCPDHPSTRMLDTEIEMDVENRAKMTCPPGLSVDPSSVRNAGYGVWCDIAISKNTVFGPYEGEIIKKYDVKNLGKVCDGGYSWEIYSKGKLLHYIDGSNRKMSNWMRYVNCARNEEEQNLIAFQYKGLIFYRAFKDIKANVELFVWYGTHYASQLGIESTKLKAIKTDCEKKATCVKKNNDTKASKKSFEKPWNTSGASSAIGSGLKRANEEKKMNLSEPDVRPRQRDSKDNSGNWKCHICGKSLCTEHYLEIHLKTVHQGEKPYKCDICGGRFAHIGDLKRHRRTHTGEKPYKCDICGERFAHIGNLKRHRRTHTGEKPYKCDICGERFAHTSSLKSHRRIHTGEKPYKCEECGKRFTRQSSRASHCRTHHSKSN